MSAPYPWQVAQWQQLLDRHCSGQLSHAYLLTGRDGVGVNEFTHAISQRLLCESATEGLLGDDAHFAPACGDCRGCALFGAGSHPDYTVVEPEEAGKAITIDQIRGLANFYSLKSHYDRYKITVIYAADTMNRAAANALLKTLEEPPAKALLLLVSGRYDAIPVTVRSRCQRLNFEPIEQSIAEPWLDQQLTAAGLSADSARGAFAMSMGAPLAALEAVKLNEADPLEELLQSFIAICDTRESALNTAKIYREQPPIDVVERIIRLVYQLLVYKAGAQPFHGEFETSQIPTLKAVTDHLNLKDLYALLDLLFETKGLLLGGANLRDSDVMDTVWLKIADACRSHSNSAQPIINR